MFVISRKVIFRPGEKGKQERRKYSPGGQPLEVLSSKLKRNIFQNFIG